MNKLKQLQKLLTKIPKGKVTTYKILAKKLKIHPRVVGKLLSKNPNGDKYPCYKVIRSDGRLGGYTSPRGIKEKMERLKKNGILIKNNKIGKEFFFYF
jgi:alkylated DNA nucleotide flippase Atl1